MKDEGGEEEGGGRRSATFAQGSRHNFIRINLTAIADDRTKEPVEFPMESSFKFRAFSGPVRNKWTWHAVGIRKTRTSVAAVIRLSRQRRAPSGLIKNSARVARSAESDLVLLYLNQQNGTNRSLLTKQ